MDACTRCLKLTGAAAPSAPATTTALIGFGEWFRRAVWESCLGEQLERVAVNMKNKVKICFQCA